MCPADHVIKPVIGSHGPLHCVCVSVFVTKASYLFHCSTEDDLNLGTAFSAETNRRDEDADMYVYKAIKREININNWTDEQS